jgi:four helix bundle protein
MSVNDYRDLAAWKRVDELRQEFVAITAKENVKRDFNFCDQVSRAASSACHNTSEGWGRFRPTENVRFLEFAKASICELQDCLIEAHEKKYIDQSTFDRLWALTRRALGTNTNYMKYLRRCIRTDEKPWLKQERSRKPQAPEP